MKRVLLVSTLVLLVASFAAPTGAQDKKKEGDGPPKVERGPEHKVLETLTGTFDANVKFFFPDPTKPTISKGLMTRKMILGGNFMQENFSGEFFGSKFTGIGLVGFDYAKKKFTTTWCDSMSTSMMLMEGTYDPAKKTLTSVGDDYEPSAKKKMKARDILTIISADEQKFEMFRLPEGEKAEFKIMEITYVRKKMDKKVEKK